MRPIRGMSRSAGTVVFGRGGGWSGFRDSEMVDDSGNSILDSAPMAAPGKAPCGCHGGGADGLTGFVQENPIIFAAAMLAVGYWISRRK